MIQEVKFLQTVHASCTEEVKNLAKMNRNLEASIKTGQDTSKQRVTQELADFKRKRPDLFQLTMEDQINRFVKIFMSS